MAEEATFEVLPGQLQATVRLHDAAFEGMGTTIPCWTAVSYGLSSVGQREISLTLVRSSDDPNKFPVSILKYLGVMHGFAGEGRFVNDGGFSGFAPPGPFGLGEFVGLAFASTRSVSAIDIPHDGLVGVFLTEGELAMAMQISVERVLRRLGQAYRYFPFPYWSDPARHSVYAAGDADTSILAKFPRLKARDSWATIAGEVLEFSVGPETSSALSTQLGRGDAAAVLPGRDPGVTAALVWSPGQTEPAAISTPGADGRRIAATYVALVPNSTDVDQVRFQEDGCAVLLSQRTTAELLNGLRDQSPVRIDDRESSRAVIIGPSSGPTTEGAPGLAAYNSPAGGTYVADWSTATPARPAPAGSSRGAVALAQVVMLNPEHEFSANVDNQDLIEVVRYVQHVLDTHLGSTMQVFEVLIRVEITPTGTSFEVRARGDIDTDAFSRVGVDLGTGHQLASRSQTLSLDIPFSINGAPT